MFERPVLRILRRRFSETRRFIQVLAGPRQTGKTTVARQAMARANMPSHYASADEPTLKDRIWIEQQWEAGRAKARFGRRTRKALLVLDEIQKIPGWSETVKRLWDEDSANDLPLHVVVLGSSALLVQQGLTESLAGRFEVIPVGHWLYSEMREAFRWDADTYVFFGGYPGAAPLIKDRQRWLARGHILIIDYLVRRYPQVLAHFHFVGKKPGRDDVIANEDNHSALDKPERRGIVGEDALPLGWLGRGPGWKKSGNQELCPGNCARDCASCLFSSLRWRRPLRCAGRRTRSSAMRGASSGCRS